MSLLKMSVIFYLNVSTECLPCQSIQANVVVKIKLLV